MLKKNRILFSIGYFLITVVLAGCSSGGGGITVEGTTNQPSETGPMDTATRTPTPAPTSTWTATISPTATKVPDLEIYNSRVVDMSKTIGRRFLLGSIRNNTDIPMILPSREHAFTFNFNGYDSYGDQFIHYWGGPTGLKPDVESPNCNCILYPHESGVIYFDIAYLDELPGFSSNQEILEKYNGPLGLFYTYTSTFKPAPDLSAKYHPKAENVKFHVADGNIYFEYDINVPAPAHKETEKGMVMGFLTMYDREGNIINFLYEDIRFDLPWENPYDNTVHMLGQSPDGDYTIKWQWFLQITNEDLQKVDHIELLFETQYEGICFDKRYTK